MFIVDDIFYVVSKVYECCKGGYVVVVMFIGYGLVGFCDLNGICLLIYGLCEIDVGMEYIIVFEFVVIMVFGFKVECDIVLGEVIFIDL